MSTTRPQTQVSEASEVLRPNESAERPARRACVGADTIGTAEPSGPIARRDPRHTRELSERDLAALLFIGRWICAQYQLALALFPGRSETAVSRCVQRLLQLELIRVTRWNRIGLNMLQLRSAGARLLIDCGLAEEKDLFVPRSPVATKDMPHHLWIVDTGLAFRSLPVAFDVLPCWALRRRFGGQKVPVPDLLAVNDDASRVIAVEIDLASERTKWLTAKLSDLADALRRIAPGAHLGVIVLTIGERRIESLRASTAGTSVPTVIRALPLAVGRPAVPALTKLLLEA